MTAVESIIICTGLTRKTISPELHLQSSLENIGRGEIARLMGVGGEVGLGPLPAFLRLACGEQDSANNGVHVIFLTETDELDSGSNTNGTQIRPRDTLHEPFRELSTRAEVVVHKPKQLPWDDLRDKIEELNKTES